MYVASLLPRRILTYTTSPMTDLLRVYQPSGHPVYPLVSDFSAYARRVPFTDSRRYIETDGVGATVRPWFWIAALLIGPIIDYIFGSVYMFLSVRPVSFLVLMA